MLVIRAIPMHFKEDRVVLRTGTVVSVDDGNSTFRILTAL